jgi:hypothetical protein
MSSLVRKDTYRPQAKCQDSGREMKSLPYQSSLYTSILPSEAIADQGSIDMAIRVLDKGQDRRLVPIEFPGYRADHHLVSNMQYLKPTAQGSQRLDRSQHVIVGDLHARVFGGYIRPLATAAVDCRRSIVVPYTPHPFHSSLHLRQLHEATVQGAGRQADVDDLDSEFVVEVAHT